MSIRKFYKAYQNLRGGDQIPVRNAIMKAAGWSQQTFSYKKNGKRGINENEIRIVETIFEKYGVDAWTGEILKQTA